LRTGASRSLGAAAGWWWFTEQNAVVLAWGKAAMTQCADAKDECRPVICIK
jgi:hypothetical protein